MCSAAVVAVSESPGSLNISTYSSHIFLISSAPSITWSSLKFSFNSCSLFTLVVRFSHSCLCTMVGGFSNLGSVVMHIGLSVKLTTKHGNSEDSQFTKLAEHINPGWRI